MIRSLGLGGLEKQLVDLVRRLGTSKVNPRVLVLTPGGERLPSLKNAGIAVSEVNARGNRFMARWKAVRREYHSFRPEIVVSFDLASALYTVLVPHKRRNPFLVAYWGASYFPDYRMRLLFRCLHPFLDRIISNSYSGADYLLRRFQIGAGRGGVICNGLDIEAMAQPSMPVGSLRKEIPIPDATPMAGIIGKLNWDKDPMNAAEAAAIVHRRVPKAAFCFIGSGPLHADVTSYLRAQGLTDHFHLIPQRPDAPWLAREFDIAVLCSRSEGFPNVILEYMYWGKPCVVTDVGDCGRIVVEGETGYVVPPLKPEALAQGILRLLSDPELARSMGVKGRRRLEAMYPIHRFMEQFQGILDSLIPPE